MLPYMSVETSPVEKSFVNGIAQLGSHIYASILSLILTAIIEANPDNTIGAFYLYAFTNLVSMVCILMSR